jgi:glycine cleavage system H protein
MLLDIEHCEFPDDLLYHLEDNTWINEDQGIVTVGITSLLSAIAGKLTAARIKPIGTKVNRGGSLGTLEGVKFVGRIPSPVSGTITAVNDDLVNRPKLLNDSPYTNGWIVKLRPASFLVEKILLSRSFDAADTFRKRISETHARCFKAFPDYEMIEVGTECSAVLAHLNDLLKTVAIGETVHLVTDDPTSYVEMVRWTDQTHHELADWRKEGNLFHFIVRKLH